MASLFRAIILLFAVTSVSRAYVVHTDVRFYLFTKENRGNHVIVDQSNITVSRDDTVVFLIHGWNGNHHIPYFADLTRLFLTRPNCTVIQVDWHAPASQFYPYAIMDALQVADIIGDFIISVANTGVSLKKVHIVGQSLGGQVVGFVGKRLLRDSLKLGRITSLDPAGVLFDSYFMADKYRLSRSDAELVVVIHTDMGLLGSAVSTGHVDFYPNGGRGPQPGCPDNAGSDNIFACDHARSHQFFIDALEHPNTFVGTECRNYDVFIEGGCSVYRQVDLGGELTVSDEGNYYLTTNPRPPYGQGPRRCS